MSLRAKILTLVLIVLCTMLAVVVISVYGLRFVSDLAGAGASPGAIGKTAERCVWVVVLVGMGGFFLACGLLQMAVAALMRKLDDVACYMADSGTMLADAAREGGKDFPRMAGAQAKALMYMAEDLAVFIGGQALIGRRGAESARAGDD